LSAASFLKTVFARPAPICGAVFSYNKSRPAADARPFLILTLPRRPTTETASALPAVSASPSAENQLRRPKQSANDKNLHRKKNFSTLPFTQTAKFRRFPSFFGSLGKNTRTRENRPRTQ